MRFILATVHANATYSHVIAENYYATQLPSIIIIVAYYLVYIEVYVDNI